MVGEVKFKEYLQKNNISVTSAAKGLGVSRQHIYDLMNGKAFPSRKLASKIEVWSMGALSKEKLIFEDKL